ncbi:MAG: group II intron maturase-specific domain-containing protein [Paracoccaceae bacterium]
MKALRREIKKRTSRATLVLPFKDLIWSLNPLISGWRNYFQYATGASDEFQSLDNWLWHRIDRWLQKKHRKTGARKLRAKFRAGWQLRTQDTNAAQCTIFLFCGRTPVKTNGRLVP